MKKVRLIISGLTDTRYLEKRLHEAGIEIEHDKVSMASGERREHFNALQEKHNWHSLPMVFADGEFIGGELEILERLPGVERLTAAGE